MEKIIEAWTWLVANSVAIVAVLTTGVAFAEAIVRLTPTKKDDGAVERFGAVISKILDFLKFPNLKK